MCELQTSWQLIKADEAGNPLVLPTHWFLVAPEHELNGEDSIIHTSSSLFLIFLVEIVSKVGSLPLSHGPGLTSFSVALFDPFFLHLFTPTSLHLLTHTHTHNHGLVITHI